MIKAGCALVWDRGYSAVSKRSRVLWEPVGAVRDVQGLAANPEGFRLALWDARVVLFAAALACHLYLAHNSATN